MNNFFSTIIYSAANEDPSSELAALKLSHDDTVLTITGSGARALDLLIAEPKKIISIDMNEKQNFLLALKCSAYKNLNYPDFAQFLGLTACNDRLSIYKKLSVDLSDEAKSYWDQQLDKIESGILYCGVWETYLLKLSWLTRFRRDIVKQLFDAETVEQQKAIFEKKWNGFFWKQFIKLLNVRWIWKVLLKEPGIDLIDPKLHIGRYIHERLAYVISHQKAKTNPFLNLIVFGKYHKDCLPL
ncbi:BtaA family protein, partial [Psychromonas sp.]|nr:BtaA family protein [Psychromonas sp.]